MVFHELDFFAQTSRLKLAPPIRSLSSILTTLLSFPSSHNPSSHFNCSISSLVSSVTGTRIDMKWEERKEGKKRDFSLSPVIPSLFFLSSTFSFYFPSMLIERTVIGNGYELYKFLSRRIIENSFAEFMIFQVKILIAKNPQENKYSEQVYACKLPQLNSLFHLNFSLSLIFSSFPSSWKKLWRNLDCGSINVSIFSSLRHGHEQNYWSSANLHTTNDLETLTGS